jgi:hypothetical protein
MPEADPAQIDDPHLAIEFAWRVHHAIQQWTHNVDQKASIVLVFTTALAAVAAREVLSADGALYATHGFRLWLLRAMAGLFASSALFALSAVFPYLRTGQVAREAGRGLIYFGHLHHRSAVDILRDLRRLDERTILEQLAREVQVTSSIAWRKHLRLRTSLVLLLLAATLFAVARLTL